MTLQPFVAVGIVGAWLLYVVYFDQAWYPGRLFRAVTSILVAGGVIGAVVAGLTLLRWLD